VAALPVTAQALVAAASVWGQHSPMATIVSVAQLSGGQPEVDAAVAAGLLTETTSVSELTFTHPLYRAAVYGDLSPTTRRELHGRAAEHVAGRARLAHRVAASLGADDELPATSKRLLWPAGQWVTPALQLGVWNKRPCCHHRLMTGSDACWTPPWSISRPPTRRQRNESWLNPNDPVPDATP